MTRQEMQDRVQGIAELMGKAWDYESAEKLEQDEFLHIDIACGGYMLVWRKVSSGGERSFYGNGRMTNKEFNSYTSGIRDTLYLQDLWSRQA